MLKGFTESLIRNVPASGVAVGCLDTGVDGAHPALRGRIERFRLFNPDGFSWQDDPPTDWSWHGTHVAGLIAGCANGDTVSEVRLICGAVIEQGAIIARILLGLDWLAGCGLSVANLSLGLPGATPVFRTMVGVLADQDVLITAPIGNRGAGSACAPGTYPEVLSIGAADAQGRAARFSGSLNDPVTKRCCAPAVLAPGIQLTSAVPGGGFEARSGTSMASAVVAGMAAALRAAFPHAPASVVARALCRSARPLDLEQQHRVRWGHVRINEAFRHLQEADAEPTFVSPERACFPRFRDKRLTDRLAQGLDTSEQEAILEFDNDAASRDFAAEMTRIGDGAIRKFIKLQHAPIVIVRAPVWLLQRALASDTLRAASACDIERPSHFR